jgi:hypothetical protein
MPVATQKKKIRWLIENEDLWYCHYDNEIDIRTMLHLKNKMREAGLYGFVTENQSINLKTYLKKARTILDRR